MPLSLYQRVQRALNLMVETQDCDQLTLRDLLWDSSYQVAQAKEWLIDRLNRRKVRVSNEIENSDGRLIYRTMVRLNRSERVCVTVTSPTLNRHRFDAVVPSRAFDHMLAAALAVVVEVTEQADAAERGSR